MKEQYWLLTYSHRYGTCPELDFETIVTNMSPPDKLHELVNKRSNWQDWAIVFALAIDRETYLKYEKGFLNEEE